jgi:hypothetical protein
LKLRKIEYTLIENNSNLKEFKKERKKERKERKKYLFLQILP